MNLPATTNFVSPSATDVSLRRVVLALVCILVAGCASGPPTDWVRLNSGTPEPLVDREALRGRVTVPFPSRDQFTADIFNLDYPLDDRRFHDAQRRPLICRQHMDETIAITHRVNGGLFDLREPSIVDTATFQAALKPGVDGCAIRPVKIEIELESGLSINTSTSAGSAKVLTARDGVWVTDLPNQEKFFLFVLTSVDMTVAPARSRGDFKLVARKLDDNRLLFLEGAFSLREFDSTSRFIP